LETAILGIFCFARDWIAAGGGASRRATAESAKDERQQGKSPQIFHCVEASEPAPVLKESVVVAQPANARITGASKPNIERYFIERNLNKVPLFSTKIVDCPEIVGVERTL
jgi:hypothetical protein